jgi:Swt1-like HEPN
VHRSLVYELIQARHDHRHNQPFGSTYTLRTLDSIARLLDAIQATAEVANELWHSYDDLILRVVQERGLAPVTAHSVPTGPRPSTMDRESPLIQQATVVSVAPSLTQPNPAPRLSTISLRMSQQFDFMSWSANSSKG